MPMHDPSASPSRDLRRRARSRLMAGMIAGTVALSACSDRSPNGATATPTPTPVIAQDAPMSSPSTPAAMSTPAAGSNVAQPGETIDRAALAQKFARRFAKFDADHDGFLTRSELPGGKADRLIALLDTDHDGKLSRAEFVDGRLALVGKKGKKGKHGKLHPAQGDSPGGPDASAD